MSECAVGQRPIPGFVWKVKIAGVDAEMCEFHGRVCQLGQKLAGLLGVDHPALVGLLEAADLAMNSVCPAGGVTPLPEPGAEGQNSPLLRRGLATRCAGVPDGVGVS